MKKILKKTHVFLIILFLSIAIPPSLGQGIVQASSLELIGTDIGLSLKPEDTKLFDITLMNPGETVTSNINISNNYANPFELFLRTEREGAAPLQGEPDLYKKLQLTVVLEGVVLFKGSMYDFANSTDSISLGVFDTKEVKKLVATVYLPGPETGNEFQGKSLDTRWVFTATSKDILEAPGELPKTGSHINSYLYSLLGLLLIGAGSFGVYKFRGPKERRN